MAKLSKFNQQVVDKIDWKYPEELAAYQWTQRGIAGELVRRKKICYGLMISIFLVLSFHKVMIEETSK